MALPNFSVVDSPYFVALESNTQLSMGLKSVLSAQNVLDFLWLHAQALTLAALAGAALVEYFDHKSGAKAEQYAKFVPPKD
ncbi:hypothetical protein D5086_024063 [Populus alba]|uniref:Uncharacterized protein n=1 Tax=Populus alba TaxID=43335 RepID=A0ACC4B4N9_POPAL